MPNWLEVNIVHQQLCIPLYNPPDKKALIECKIFKDFNRLLHVIQQTADMILNRNKTYRCYLCEAHINLSQNYFQHSDPLAVHRRLWLQLNDVEKQKEHDELAMAYSVSEHLLKTVKETEAGLQASNFHCYLASNVSSEPMKAFFVLHVVTLHLQKSRCVYSRYKH